ncbi:MAG: ABC transporter substrate-binding protein, partial [Pseudomonadota bacterium]
MKNLRSLFVLVAAAGLALPMAAESQQPRSGGELVFPVPSEPPSYDGHREETFGLIHPFAPFYNTLLRVDPNDKSGTKPYPSLAQSWTVSPDGKTYTFKLVKGVKFHDGSEMTSKDVKASYDKIIFPPPGVGSTRKGQYANVAAVEAPDAGTVVFKLKAPSGSFMASLLSPYNFIYKADILAKDMHWYEKNVMGTGPFTFVEHVKGSHVVGKKNSSYWDKGKPYLDGFRAVFMRESAAQVAAVRGERAHIQFRSFTPKDRDNLKAALGDKITVQESAWDCILMAAINHEKKPFDDKRVRRALTLALDRHEGSKALSQIAIVKSVAGVQVPGTPYATPPEELNKLAGYWTDAEKSRAEARKLLKEAGVPEGFSFTF